MGFAPGCFLILRVRPTFLAIFPCSPFEEFQKVADFGVFAKLAIFRKDTKIDHFLKFFKKGAQGKSLKK